MCETFLCIYPESNNLEERNEALYCKLKLIKIRYMCLKTRRKDCIISSSRIFFFSAPTVVLKIIFP
jgi:hypothetical protein